MAEKKAKPEADVMTINIAPFLMPGAVVLASCFISLAMVISSSVLSSAGGFVLGDSNAAAPEPTAIAGDEVIAPTTGSVSVDNDPYKGNKDTAKVAIVEFSDYECPFCQRFKDQTLDQILENYVDTGEAIFVYRDYPLAFHAQAEPAALAAECVYEQSGRNNDTYFDYHDELFALTETGTLNEENIVAAAAKVGINTATVQNCIANETHKSEIDDDFAAGTAAGINGTPGFIVGVLGNDGNVEGQLVSGAQPFSAFQDAIEAQLARL